MPHNICSSFTLFCRSPHTWVIDQNPETVAFAEKQSEGDKHVCLALLAGVHP